MHTSRTRHCELGDENTSKALAILHVASLCVKKKQSRVSKREDRRI
jgi:hypothetical protein